MTDAYLQELLLEKDSLDSTRFVHAIRLLEDEVLRITKNEEVHHDDRRGGESSSQLDDLNKKPKYRSYSGGIVTEEIVKLSEKVVVPVKEYPKFNFVGKLLGPRGNTLKRLQAATQTRMSVLGRGSTRDKDKEEELSKSGDPKYEHLAEPLHVLIEVEGPKSEAHGRLAAALAEIKKYMVPENDEIRQEQMREMALLNSFDKTPDSAAISTHMIGGGGRGRAPMAAPIVRVGIPPPGAIILNGQPPMSMRGRGPRVIRGRPAGVRQIAIPRHAAPAPDPYAYDAYETTFDATYEGYPDTGEATVYYEYPEDYPQPNNNRPPPPEKRPAPGPPGGFGAKKFRGEATYREVSYPAPLSDPYRSASLR